MSPLVGVLAASAGRQSLALFERSEMETDGRAQTKGDTERLVLVRPERAVNNVGWTFTSLGLIIGEAFRYVGSLRGPRLDSDKFSQGGNRIHRT